MKRQVPLYVGFVALITFAPVFAAEQCPMVMQKVDLIPLAFTQNKGQWGDSILFRAGAGGATIWFTPGGAYYQFTRRVPNPGEIPAGASDHLPASDDHFNLGKDNNETLMIKVSFDGANPNPRVAGWAEMEYKCNYFLGGDPAKWRTGVPNYEQILLENVYPGIDLTYYGRGRQMEYDFRVSAGADYRQIQIRYEGAESLEVGADRALIIRTAWGEIRELAPVVYQERDGEKRIIEAEYIIENATAFRFRLGSEYDPVLPVVIDPVLSFSTFLGGSDGDWGSQIVVDDSGCAYVTGYTQSSNFPTQNAYDASLNAYLELDAFVTKFSPTGNTLVYSTYLGGTFGEKGYGIAVDKAGCVYLTGFTQSPDYPTINAFDDSYNYGNHDAFATKLSAAGNALIYSTFLGGSDGGEEGLSVTLDRTGCAYIGGCTSSSDFPTQNAYDAEFNGGPMDGFVTKLSATGSTLEYSTYLGGTDYDVIGDIVVDSLGCAYVMGQVSSSDLPVENGYDASYNGGVTDAYVAKLSAAGNALVYATYLGGAEADGSGGIALDGAGCAYVTGYTGSADFPTRNAYDSTINSSVAEVAFITKLSPTGNDLVYSTYLGGSAYSSGNRIAVDRLGYAYIIGETNSADFPTKHAYDSIYEGSPYLDVFMAKLSSFGTSLVYSTFLGGIWDDRGVDLALDKDGCVYGTGETRSSDFPTQNAYDAEYSDFTDAFVVKLCHGPVYLCGDANGDKIINVGDAVYIIGYIFRGGPAPDPLEAGDANCDGKINVGDAVYIIGYVFRGGPAPCCP